LAKERTFPLFSIKIEALAFGLYSHSISQSLNFVQDSNVGVGGEDPESQSCFLSDHESCSVMPTIS